MTLTRTYNTFVFLLLCLLNPSLFTSKAQADYYVVVPSKTDRLENIARSVISKIDSGEKGHVISLDELKDTVALKPSLYISIGNSSFKAATSLDIPTPTLGAFLYKEDFELHRKNNSSAVFNGTSPKLQLSLANEVFPGSSPVVGIVYSVRSEPFIQELERINSSQPKSRQISIRKIKMGADESPAKALSKLSSLYDLDAFILQPDNQIYHKRNLKSVFYTLYKKRIAALVFSPGLVVNGAGGVASAYYKDTEVVNSVSNLAKQYINDKEIPEPGFPLRASVEVNKRLARSLSIVSLDKRTLEIKINGD